MKLCIRYYLANHSYGVCVDKNKKDINESTGTIPGEISTKNDCLEACYNTRVKKVYLRITACEYSISLQRCIYHRSDVSGESGNNNSSCWIFQAGKLNLFYIPLTLFYNVKITLTRMYWIIWINLYFFFNLKRMGIKLRMILLTWILPRSLGWLFPFVCFWLS